MVRSFTGPHRLLVGIGQQRHDRALIGGKGASLSHLSAIGAPVPNAVALTTHAYTAFSASLGLPSRIIASTDEDLPSIRSAILEGPMPAPVADAIAGAFDALREVAAGGLAVRSSAVAEDAGDYSFAGLHDTVLDVCSLDDLEAAVRRCWASLWSDRAVSYRRTGGHALDAAEIAVVVQRLVHADVSFVAFTADPVSGNPRHAIISASWGLGEAVVSGMVTPDHIVVGPGGEIVEHTIGRKERMLISASAVGAGPRMVPVPRMLQRMPVMTAEQAAEIAAMARAVSRRLGYPADLEGGIADGELHLFQARPITTLSLTPEPAHMVVEA